MGRYAYLRLECEQGEPQENADGDEPEAVSVKNLPQHQLYAQGLQNDFGVEECRHKAKRESL